MNTRQLYVLLRQRYQNQKGWALVEEVRDATGGAGSRFADAIAFGLYPSRGMEMLFVLKGPKGAIQFLLYTNWQLPHVRKDFEERMRFESVSSCLVMPMAADIGYHSPKPMYEGQEARECDVLGGKCYYDGSGLRAQEPFDILVSKGLDALWEYLEDDYRERFPTKTTPWQE